MSKKVFRWRRRGAVNARINKINEFSGVISTWDGVFPRLDLPMSILTYEVIFSFQSGLIAPGHLEGCHEYVFISSISGIVINCSQGWQWCLCRIMANISCIFLQLPLTSFQIIFNDLSCLGCNFSYLIPFNG
jgi:hypothetical protein